MFCDEKLRKIKFRAFLQEDGHEFYRLKALITLEQVNTTVVEKIRTIFLKLAKPGWSGVVNFHCMQMGIVMSMRFI